MPISVPTSPTVISNNLQTPRPMDYYVLNRVSSFYQNSWDMLIRAISIILGIASFLGILLPYLAYLKYKKTLEDEKEKILKELTQYVDSEKRKISAELTQHIDAVKSELNTEIENAKKEAKRQAIVTAIALGS